MTVDNTAAKKSLLLNSTCCAANTPLHMTVPDLPSNVAYFEGFMNSFHDIHVPTFMLQQKHQSGILTISYINIHTHRLETFSPLVKKAVQTPNYKTS